MAILSDTEIDAMRSVAEATLGGTAIIQTQTLSSDGGGGGTATWTPSGTVACRLVANTPPRDAEPMTGGRITPDADWIVTLPAETSITTERRIVTHGKTLEVAAVSDRTFEITQRVFANEVS